MSETYAGAGVDVDAGRRAVDLIRRSVASTARPEVVGGLGGFGGLFAFDPGKYRQPTTCGTWRTRWISPARTARVTTTS